MTPNAASPTSVKRAKSREERRLQREQEDLKELLKHEFGRRFIWKYLSRCRIFASSFTGESQTTIFREGERNIGVQLLSEVVDADPEAFLRMMKEKNVD